MLSYRTKKLCICGIISAVPKKSFMTTIKEELIFPFFDMIDISLFSLIRYRQIPTKRVIDMSDEEVKTNVEEIHSLIKAGKYSFALNNQRLENRYFATDNNINSKNIKDIVLQITEKDFYKAVRNANPKKDSHKDEILYIFSPTVLLFNGTNHKKVRLYMKFCLTKTVRGEDVLIIISCKRWRGKPPEVRIRC